MRCKFCRKKIVRCDNGAETTIDYIKQIGIAVPDDINEKLNRIL
jgi:hypothetical protein